MTDRRLILRSWLYAMGRMEAKLRGEQAQARNSMIRQAALAYEGSGSTPGHVFGHHEDRVYGLLTDHYRRTIPVFAKLAMGQIKSRKIEKKHAQTIYESLIAEWITREAARKAKYIADTDRDEIAKAVAQGIAEGEGTAAIASRIRKVSSLTAYRASVIARTETHAAATYGSIESVREAERTLDIKMKKEWLATKDSRTRQDHLAADGQTVAMEEKFMVGSEAMDRPGDTSASPSQTIACRCALAYSEA